MRYYFHLRENGVLILDEEGRELSAPNAAREAAKREARALMASEVLLGKLPLSAALEVQDETGRCVLELSFREAVSIDG
jgi:hypothetical protein